jgi:hypothetical protein
MANRRYIDFPIASTSGDTDIILIWQDGANKQTTKATFLSGLPENLEDLNDVAISGLTNGQILRYDSVTGKWENTDQGNLDLNDLNDVSIVSPSNGQVLVYNSSTSKWENSSGGYVPYTGAVTTVNLGAQTIQAGSFVKAGGTSSQFLKADGSVDSNTYGTGTVTSVALTMPAAFSVANSPVTTAGTLAVTGTGNASQYIAGDGTLVTFPSLTGYVPYTGANQTVNLNTQQLQAGHTTLTTNGSTETLTINHTSGSGKAINVTKGGAGEGLYVNKTSGSGNAATIVGTLEATTLVKTGGTSSQFLKADGSVDSTSYQPLLTNPVTGTGSAGQIAYFTGTTAITSESGFTWDATNNNLSIGGATANSNLTVNGSDNTDIFTVLAGANSRLHVGTVTSPNNDVYIRSQNNYNLKLGTNSTNYLTILSTGNVGINTATPATAFEVNGVGLFSGTSLVGNTKNGVYIYDQAIISLTGGNSRPLQIQSQTLSIFTGTTYAEKIKVFENGNVVISTSPTDNSFKLDVNGTGRFTSTLIATNLRSSGVGAFGFNTANNGEFQIYASTTQGIIIAGRGSTNDLLITNKIGSDVIRIPTGSTNVNFAGNLISSTGVYDTTSSTNHWFARVQGNNRIITDATGYVYMPFLTSGSGIDDLGWWAGSGGSWTYNGMLMRISSSARYKKNIRDLEIDSSKIYDLKTISYENNENTGVDGLTSFGLLAEDVAEKIPLLATFNNENQPEGVQYKMLSVLLLNELKKLKQEIETLKN